MTYIKSSSPKVARIYTNSSASDVGFVLSNLQYILVDPSNSNLTVNDPEGIISQTLSYGPIRLSEGDYHIISKYRFGFANYSNASSFASAKHQKSCSILKETGTGSVTQVGKVILDFDNGGGSIGTQYCNATFDFKIRISGGEASAYYQVSGGSPFTDSNITDIIYYESMITQYPLNTF